jgi:hypothetical protein
MGKSNDEFLSHVGRNEVPLYWAQQAIRRLDYGARVGQFCPNGAGRNIAPAARTSDEKLGSSPPNGKAMGDPDAVRNRVSEYQSWSTRAA